MQIFAFLWLLGQTFRFKRRLKKGLSKKAITQLQLIQNAAATVLNRKTEHISAY